MKRKKKINNEVQCPHCGSTKTNSVTVSNRYCMSCGIEFSKTKMFSILYDGNLVDYRVNEFENCG